MAATALAVLVRISLVVMLTLFARVAHQRYQQHGRHCPATVSMVIVTAMALVMSYTAKGDHRRAFADEKIGAPTPHTPTIYHTGSEYFVETTTVIFPTNLPPGTILMGEM